MDSTDNAVQRRPQVKTNKKLGRASKLAFVFTFGQPLFFSWTGLLKEQPIKAAYRKHPYIPPHTSTGQPPHHEPQNLGTPPTAESPYVEHVGRVFFEALSKAGQCRRHAASPSCRGRYLFTSPARISSSQEKWLNHRKQIRHFHEVSSLPRPRLKSSPLTREEYLSMVDYYADIHSSFEKPKTRGHIRCISGPPSPPTVPSVKLPKVVDSTLPPAIRTAIDQAVSALRHPDCGHLEAWKAYSSLPSPGVAYLTDGLQRTVLQRLSLIEKKDRESMFRYMSVMDDMKSMNLPLLECEWNTAIAFTAHSFERIDGAGVESALIKWREMEQQAGVKSGYVTFNILFDMATKAEKFVLAEMILEEMEARKLRMNRFCRTAIIYYHGMKGDGDGVRQAYRELVQAGEIVDTVVMNCVIASLIRAGELSAAEHVYERMKRTLQKYTGRRIPYIDWREPRDAGRVLQSAAQNHKNNPEAHRRLQDEQFLAPSPQTFSIMIEHHVSKTGELRRIASLLAEMERLSVPIQGRIFVKIFKGFCNHGGIRYTAWTKARLESVWNALLTSLDQKLETVKLDRWMIIWAVRAFEKCFGPEEPLHIWEELRRRWKGDFQHLASTQDILQETLRGGLRATVTPKETYS